MCFLEGVLWNAISPSPWSLVTAGLLQPSCWGHCLRARTMSVLFTRMPFALARYSLQSCLYPSLCRHAGFVPSGTKQPLGFFFFPHSEKHFKISIPEPLHQRFWFNYLFLPPLLLNYGRDSNLYPGLRTAILSNSIL